ncbi:glycoside-pentoside-hexuronide family transporter, partial [Klebsiella pneumoniae]
MQDHTLSVKEKLGYGMGDAAFHIIFYNVMLYIMFFFTVIFGLSAGFVCTLFLSSCALDAIAAPFMVLLADRTRSSWCICRLWIVLAFTRLVPCCFLP